MVAPATSIPNHMSALRREKEDQDGPTLAEILSAHTELQVERDKPCSDSAVLATREGTYGCVADVMLRMRQLMDVVGGGGYTLTLRSQTTSEDGDMPGEYTEVLEQRSDGTWSFFRTIKDQG